MKKRALPLVLALLLALSACGAPAENSGKPADPAASWDSEGGAFKQEAYSPSDVGAVFSDGTNIYALGNYMSENTPMVSSLWRGEELIYSVEGALSSSGACGKGIWLTEDTYSQDGAERRVVLMSPEGDELSSFRLSEAAGSRAPYCSEDRLYFFSGKDILISDFSGGLLKTIPCSAPTASLILGGDGKAYLINPLEAKTEISQITDEGLVHALTLPAPAPRLFGGNEEYLFISGDDTGLYGLSADGSAKPIIIWADCGLSVTNLRSVCPLSGGEFLIRDSGGISRLSPVDPSEMRVKTELELAAVYSAYSAGRLASEFNRQSDDYFITVRDYSQNDSVDVNTATLRLSTDIISGNYPDLIFFSGLSPSPYIGKGLLTDLNLLISGDPDISPEDIAILPQLQRNGGLFYLCDSFSISSAVGLYSRFGDAFGWTIEDYLEIDGSLGPDTVMRYNSTKAGLLSQLAVFYVPSAVDWQTGSCRFDSEEFISLLSSINKTKENPEQLDAMGASIDMEDSFEAVGNGHRIIGPTLLRSVRSMAENERRAGCRLSFIGSPTIDGDCGSQLYLSRPIGICSQSAHIDGCWEFLKFTLTGTAPETSERLPVYAPYLKAQFEAAKAQADEGGIKLTDEDERRFYSLLSQISVTSLRDEALLSIIAEEGEALFSGRATAGETAKRIQQRASIYVSEQS